jgi:hypothetical protein
VLGKVRPTTHRGDEPTLEPEVGLSDGRLALVHRYMIDAEEAEARRAAVETDAAPAQAPARPRPSARTAAEVQQRRARTDKLPLPPRREQRQAEERPAETARIELEPDGAGQEAPRPARSSVNGVAAVAVEAVPEVIRPAHAEGQAPARRAVGRDEKRAAKQAARLLAALEKREARERKALVKAAARRR